MSSRQQEKEQRKREREERERAAAKEAQRKRTLQIAGGFVVGAAIVAGVVLALAGGGGAGNRPSASKLASLANAASCTVRTFPEEGRNHVTKKLTAADYKTNPPTSGDHVPPGQEARDGVYAIGNEPNIGNWVHTLEHGRIIFQYKPGTPPGTVAELQKLFDAKVLDSGSGYHSLLMQNNSKMPFEVAAVAWRHYIGCEKFSPAAIPAMNAFRELYVDTAPEQVP
ncbi:MAG: hypothetical protein QOI73_842 [Solirubrobacteraceae bacterium]|nr:hypothetical protein [Solirubrobacteraceae bacterium]